MGSSNAYAQRAREKEKEEGKRRKRRKKKGETDHAIHGRYVTVHVSSDLILLAL